MSVRHDRPSDLPKAMRGRWRTAARPLGCLTRAHTIPKRSQPGYITSDSEGSRKVRVRIHVVSAMVV